MTNRKRSASLPICFDIWLADMHTDDVTEAEWQEFLEYIDDNDDDKWESRQDVVYEVAGWLEDWLEHRHGGSEVRS